MQSSSDLLRMFVLIISWSSLIMGGMGSKSRSLGQILVKSCLHSLGHIFGSVFLRVAQNVCLEDISIRFDHGWDGVKSRTLGQIFVKSCLQSRGHNIDAIFFKLAQNVCLDNILIKVDHWWDGVRKLVTRSNLSKILFTL